MLMKPLAAAGLLIAALTACAPQPTVPSDDDFATARELLTGSPALKKQAVAQCVAGTAGTSSPNNVMLAQLMNVPLNRVPDTYCRRMIDGVASGRLTRAEMAAASSGKLSVNLVRVLQGR